MQPPRSAPRWVRPAVLVGITVLGLLALTLLLVMIAQAGRILPGTQVLGADLGGRDEWSARRVVQPALAAEERRPFAISVPGERILARPSDLGLRLDVDATVTAALARGRSGVGAPATRLVAPLRPSPLAPRGAVDEARLAAWLDELAARIERDASFGDLVLDADGGTADVAPPRGSLRIDREESAARLRAALLDPDVTRVELAVEISLPPATRPALEGIARQVERALAGPTVLYDDGRLLTIEPATLARLLEVRAVAHEGSTRTELTIDRDRAERILGSRGRSTFDRAAVDALIVTPDVPPFLFTDLSSTTFMPTPVDTTVVRGERRTDFRVERTARQLVAMVMDGVRTARADLAAVDPSLTTEAALAGRPTHLLGTFTTFHAAGAPRTVNIRLLADLLDGAIVAPGEEFSVNRASGPRRCEDGFVPAGTIVRGELVDTCGGGVSQLGTTLMNAAFFSGLPLEQWQPHSFFISRYPAGREATLSFPELDVQFHNDTDGLIVLRTSHTADSITVALYGKPSWREVRAAHGERRSPTSYSETIRATTDLPPGSRRVVQSGGDGFTIDVSRTRLPLDADEDPVVERWRTVYRPQQRIVEIGSAAVNPGVAPDGAAPPGAADAATGG